jgi:hypothetical protein
MAGRPGNRRLLGGPASWPSKQRPELAAPSSPPGSAAFAATVAGALGRNPAVTRAADTDPILAGLVNDATNLTTLRQPAGGSGGFAVSSRFSAIIGVAGSTVVPTVSKIGVAGYDSEDAAARGVFGYSGPGTGVQGESPNGRGLLGNSTAGTGLRAQSNSGVGVWASSATNRAVLGTTGAGSLPAITGQNTTGMVGVQGFGGTGPPPAPTEETGVEGVCDISAQANGVAGRSGVGAGVWGSTGGGIGVIGTADGDTEGSGVGLYGFGPIGLYSESPAGGLAAQFAGPTVFMLSGKTTITSGSSKVVAIPDGLRPQSLVLAVLHTNRPGVWVRSVVPNVAAGTATIYLNTSVTSATFIAWFVVN